MDQLHKHDQELFAYPTHLKVFFGIGGVFLLGIASFLVWLYWESQYNVWFLPTLLYATALGSLWLWYRVQGRISVNDQSITLSRLGKSTTIYYDEIAELNHHKWDMALTIKSNSKKIKIEKQLTRYLILYQLITQYFPTSNSFTPTLPLQINTHRWIWVFYNAIFIISLWLFAQFIRSEYQAYWLLVLAIVGASISLLRTFSIPKRYIFHPDRIDVLYLSKQKTYLYKDLENIVVQQLEAPLQLQLIFANGQFQMGEMLVNYPLEKLLATVDKHRV